MNRLIQKKFLYFGIGAALLFEAVSFIAFFLPEFQAMLGIVLTLLFLAATARDIRIGIFLLFVELAIGGHGYLVSLTLGGAAFAIRHVWFVSLILLFIAREFKQIVALIKESDVMRRLIFVGVVGALATFIAYSRGVALADIFSDGNAYLFYGLVVVFALYKNYISREKLVSVLFGALIVLTVKTFITLAIFSNGLLLASEWYLWVRDLRFGEITYIEFAFYRVFFQSQVFLLPALALIGSYILHRGKTIEKHEKQWLWVLLMLFMGGFLLSFSRSFWVGAFAGALSFILLTYITRRSIISHLKTVATYFSIGLIGGLFILAAAQSFSIDPSVFVNRLRLEDESAIASRWALLPEMAKGIQESPVFGKGFGTTVTYVSSDPRILTSTGGTGKYTTFSFEWGYVDFWLKMGLVGLSALIYFYAYFLALQWKNMRKNASDWYAFGMTTSLIMLFVLHFFTPYLNHPLGIGYLALGLL